MSGHRIIPFPKEHLARPADLGGEDLRRTVMVRLDPEPGAADTCVYLTLEKLSDDERNTERCYVRQPVTEEDLVAIAEKLEAGEFEDFEEEGDD